MKTNNTEYINSGKKSQKLKREKTIDKTKDSTATNFKLFNKNSLTQNILNMNKKGINLTDSSGKFLSRKLSEQKFTIKKNFGNEHKEKERKRIFSQSLKSKEFDKKDSKSKSKEKNMYPFKENINVNINPELCIFDLYKHIKENLRNKDKLCKDKLTKESYYCLDCKLSICKKCLNFNAHKGHNLIPKYLYFNCNESIFNTCFDSIDSMFENESIILNNQNLKEELKKQVQNNIDEIIEKLNNTKIKKLNEIEKIFEGSDGCIEYFKEKENKIKTEIKNFMDNQQKFYNLKIEEEISTKASSERNENNQDYDLFKNKLEEMKENESNKDAYNTIFLINYDLIKNAEFINGIIRKLIDDIDENKNRYLTNLDDNMKQINYDIDKLSENFKGVFNYRYLTNDFYKMLSNKINKYSENIFQMKKYIYESVNNDGTFEKIIDDNNSNETKIKQRFDNILFYQHDDKNVRESLSTFSKNTNTNSNKLSTNLKGGILSQKMRLSSKLNHGKDKNIQIYKNIEDIKLDNIFLQEYFSYETFNIVRENFKFEKPKKINEIVSEVDIDQEIDFAKPIPGTNEIQLFDKKTTTLIKKHIKFDKIKHKYTTFLHGCRSVLIKDLLYILGGVDQEKNSTKMAYVYFIKTNELKMMREMICPHAYHSVNFLDYYKSIIVIGGENSKACELYDLNIGIWRQLPDLNVPRALTNLYLDKYNHALYTIFGVIGNITLKNNYTDVIEVLELKRLSLGWNKIDYENKAEMDFKSGYNKIIPLNREMILIYGATNMRDFIKKAAVYLIHKFEIVKIDNGIFKEIKEASKTEKKLTRILSSYI